MLADEGAHILLASLTMPVDPVDPVDQVEVRMGYTCAQDMDMLEIASKTERDTGLANASS